MHIDVQKDLLFWWNLDFLSSHTTAKSIVIQGFPSLTHLKALRLVLWLALSKCCLGFILLLIAPLLRTLPSPTDEFIRSKTHHTLLLNTHNTTELNFHFFFAIPRGLVWTIFSPYLAFENAIFGNCTENTVGLNILYIALTEYGRFVHFHDPIRCYFLYRWYCLLNKIISRLFMFPSSPNALFMFSLWIRAIHFFQFFLSSCIAGFIRQFLYT